VFGSFNICSIGRLGLQPATGAADLPIFVTLFSATRSAWGSSVCISAACSRRPEAAYAWCGAESARDTVDPAGAVRRRSRRLAPTTESIEQVGSSDA
jgi:hypothetical protein